MKSHSKKKDGDRDETAQSLVPNSEEPANSSGDGNLAPTKKHGRPRKVPESRGVFPRTKQATCPGFDLDSTFAENDQFSSIAKVRILTVIHSHKMVCNFSDF